MTAPLIRANRNYRLLILSSTVSRFGDGATAVALPWLATLLTRDPVLISLVAMAGRLPWFLFSLPAGVWTDRADRQRLMVRADLARMVLTLMIVALILSTPGLSGPALLFPGAGGAAPVLALAALSFLIGAAEVLHDNAAQTLLPSVVAPSDLERANGQMWSANTIMERFLGPPVAGLLIAAGIALPFGFDATSFALAAALVWLMLIPPVPLRPRAPFLKELREGVDWLRGNRLILRLAVMLGLLNASYMAIFTVLVLYAQEILHLDSLGYGLMMAAGACGGVLGGLASPRLCARLGLRRSLIVALAAFTASYAVFALTGSPVVAGLAEAVSAAGSMLWNVATVSFRQRLIPPRILGRVNSLYRFLGWGSMPLGALAGGAMVSLLEGPVGRADALRAPFALAAFGTLLMLVYAARRLRID
ncbi:MFS transporter [Solirhodobacter olei]|uniref:MFS transporter n=1 Tax=Solirhodobacter olei TaxID=2493082 RepID=UPI000FDA8667|nr:MFS transporter [Solirhodobacter olei]